jgi:hypothetical protein
VGDGQAWLYRHPVPDDHGESYSRAELDSLVGIAELRGLLSRGRARVVARSYAEQVAGQGRFPTPLITYPPEGRTHVRLWLLADVERWLDYNRPGWRHQPPAPG